MNFESLPYNKLQSECKLRNLSAKGKTLELIARLNEYETNLACKVEEFLIDSSFPDFNNFDSFFGVSETELPSVADKNKLEKCFNVDSENPPKVVLTPIAKPIFQSKPIQGTVTRPVRYFDIDAAFQGIGYFCMNNGSYVTGIQASIVLHYVFEKFPSVESVIGQNYTSENRIKVKFGIARELVETKKIIKNNRGKSASKVDYGSTAMRKIYVQNDKGTDNGMPKENRAKYNSSLTCDIYDHKEIDMLYVGDKCIFPTNYKLTVLQTQAITKSGKDRDHKGNCAYLGKTHNAKSKMSTGIKLASGIQKGINTNLRSDLFKLPEFKTAIQIQILNDGIIQLNQYLPDGSQMRIKIGSISSIDSQGIYNIDYDASFKLVGNKVIHNKIQMLINKAVKTDPSFLNDQQREIDNNDKIELAKMIKAKKQKMYDIKHGRI